MMGLESAVKLNMTDRCHVSSSPQVGRPSAEPHCDDTRPRVYAVLRCSVFASIF